MINVYDRILVAVDYSENSGRALAAARDLALLSKGEVWVLHLMERETGGKVGVVTSAETFSEAEGAVETSVKALVDAGVTAHGEVRSTLFGHAAREIIEDAKVNNADVIVMGSRGRGDLAGLLLGSTAHKVIHLADRPVLVVR
jgi:nucleotide-binding universal stress UspA family protein